MYLPQKLRIKLLYKELRMLLLFLTVMALVWPRGVVSNFMLWKGIQTPQNLGSTQGKTETFNLKSHNQCAMKASTSPWSYMFKYDNGECVLYDEKEDSQGPLKVSGTSTTIFTRLHNGQSVLEHFKGIPIESSYERLTYVITDLDCGSLKLVTRFFFGSNR